MVIQRVSSASVEVDGKVRGEIKTGLLVLVGAGKSDSVESARRLAGKVARLRVISDEEGRMNRSLEEVDGEVLAISQFTLYGDVDKGNRPSFVNAAEPSFAKELIEEFVSELRRNEIPVQEGVFGASMRVNLTNEGPVTILVEA